jgi:rhamnosyltransferase
MMTLIGAGEPAGPVLVTGSHVFAPVEPVDPAILAALEGDGPDLWSSYFHDLSLDTRVAVKDGPERIPYLDMALFSSDLMSDPDFAAFWRDLKVPGEYWPDFMAGPVALGRFLHQQGRRVATQIDTLNTETADPRLYEIHRLFEGHPWCLPVAVFALDPLLHDLNAIYLREAMASLRTRNAALYDCVIRWATRHLPMREFGTVAEQYRVIPAQAAGPAKTEWAFGDIAVFIHAFYAEMMPGFWTLLRRLPGTPHAFITTATEENAERIRDFLAENDWPPDRAEVRVVEQNRGRDMSALFITWRDVILDDRFTVALRLHSKRTPQVSRQVGNFFRDYLFENLVGSEAHVRNLLDMLEAEPDIGLVIPPAIHVGFGTLGHSWFNNKGTLAALASDMGIEVPLDHATPVAAYGTMYWFRTQALKKMFQWRWKWEDYNPEPHHVDGGLAHVQERLIGYCVQDAGYRVMQVMTPEMAVRNYAKLEYKYQMLSSHLGSSNAYLQREELQNLSTTKRMRLYRWMRGVYGRVLVRYPASRPHLIGMRNLVQKVLLGQENRPD